MKTSNRTSQQKVRRQEWVNDKPKVNRIAVIPTNKTIPVFIKKGLIIFISQGTDPEEAKQKYLEHTGTLKVTVGEFTD